MSLLTDEEIEALTVRKVDARAIEAAVIAKLAQGIPELVDAEKDERGGCIVCGVRLLSIAAHVHAIDTSAERVHKSAESEHDATAKAIGAALACLKGLSGPNGAVSVWRLGGSHAVNEAIAQLEALGK